MCQGLPDQEQAAWNQPVIHTHTSLHHTACTQMYCSTYIQTHYNTYPAVSNLSVQLSGLASLYTCDTTPLSTVHSLLSITYVHILLNRKVMWCPSAHPAHHIALCFTDALGECLQCCPAHRPTHPVDAVVEVGQQVIGQSTVTNLQSEVGVNAVTRGGEGGGAGWASSRKLCVWCIHMYKTHKLCRIV